MTVRDQTNLVTRSGVYYFRKKVPRDLVGHYGKEAIRKSLRDFADKPSAKQEARRLAAFYDAEFEQLRSRRAAPAKPLTAALVPMLTSALEAHVLQADDEGRIEGLDEEAFGAMLDATARDLEATRAAYARGDSGPINAQLRDWLDGMGIEADPKSPLLLQLRRRFLEAYLRALEGRAKRNAGAIVEAPAALTANELQDALAEPHAPTPAPSKRGAPKHVLSDVLSYWKSTGGKAERTVEAAEGLVREFEALHGVVPLGEVGKGHFIALRDAMLTRVKPATVQARFNLLRAAFVVCLEDDQLGITSNPMQFVKVRNVEAGIEKRDAFTVDQLQTLFDCGVFTEGERPEGGRGATAFWGPLLALFTGARLDEILSLRDDGVYVHEGVPVVHFRHRPELGQSLKGKVKNERRVPVHPELLRLGLLDYAASVRPRGPWLFPDIDRSAKVRGHSSAWGAWFGRHLSRLGIKSDSLTFHSFRHTFKHFSRASGMPEDHHDAITGHTTAEVARRYGSCAGYPVGPLAESVARLRFGALNLSRVTAAPV